MNDKLQQAKEQVAWNDQYKNWAELVNDCFGNVTRMEMYMNEAAELYRLESNKEVWNRACEAQKEACHRDCFEQLSGYKITANLRSTPNAPFQP